MNISSPSTTVGSVPRLPPTMKRREAARFQRLDTIILSMMLPVLLVDMINGYLMLSEKPLPISLLYKAVLMGLILFRTISLSRETCFLATLLLCFFSFQVFFTSTLAHQEAAEIGRVANHLSRYILFALATLFFTQLRQRNEKSRFFRAIILSNFLVVAVNLIIGIFGFGYPVYSISDGEISVGSKGFFYAGNELSATYLLLTALILSQTDLALRHTALFFAVLLFFLLLALTLATKTAIIGTLILLLSAYYLRNKVLKKEQRRISPRWLISLLVGIPSIVAISLYFFLKSEAYQHMVYLYDYSPLLIRFILSSRDLFVERAIERLLSRSDPLSFFWGIGHHETVEMDFFDTFFDYGFCGVLIVYGIFLFFLGKAFSPKPAKEPMEEYRINVLRICIIMLFFVSFISGHVLYSGLAAIPFALCCALATKETKADRTTTIESS